MTFTDDDTRQLKNACESDPDGKIKGEASQFLFLLARLEAAEKLIAWEWDKGNYQKLLEAWRKAAGK